jgi:SAM-dependent methyltransferase
MKPTTTDDVIDLLDAHTTAASLIAAMELGLFWLLAEGALETEAIAQRLDIPTNRCQYWLQLLSSVGLLEQSPGGYGPSPTARTAILDAYSQETWAFLAREMRDRSLAVHNLTRYIHEPGSAWEAQGLTRPDYFVQMMESPEMAARFTRALYEIHLPLAEAVAESLDMNGVDRLMDLGGGSGVVSLALLRRNPGLSAVVVDIPNVCVAGRQIARENAMEDRITYHAADFLHDQPPSGFGVVLACDVGTFGESLLHKIRAALDPGGRLVIVDLFAPSEGVAPSAWLYWAVLASLENPDFSLLTVAQVQDRLTNAGFQLLAERSLPHGEIKRWSGDWTMIEAQK